MRPLLFFITFRFLNVLIGPFIFSTGMYSDSISGVSKFKYPEVDDRDTVRIKTIPSQISGNNGKDFNYILTSLG